MVEFLAPIIWGNIVESRGKSWLQDFNQKTNGIISPIRKVNKVYYIYTEPKLSVVCNFFLSATLTECETRMEMRKISYSHAGEIKILIYEVCMTIIKYHVFYKKMNIR